jgi:hypothetical protein
MPNPMGQDLKVMPDDLPDFGTDEGRLKEIM